ncbi:MAG: stage III sporulation protein AF [Clostridia bacterium]|nr:stage III sporulation protein AF [Clostridia bacterium]
MGVWIMSIVGVICLGILLEIVLPEGQTAKYVKGAFSLLVVFVIAMPLPNLLGKEWNLNIDGSAFKVDEEFISSTYAAYSDGIAKSIEKELLANGYKCTVEVDGSGKTPAVIDSVRVTVVNFKQEVAPAVRADIKAIVKDKFSISEDKVDVLLKPS